MSTSTLTRAAASAAATRAPRAALYYRISDDKEGRGLGVERQREDCLALAARMGFEVVEERDDNDISAWSGKPRPGYAALLDDVREGRVDVVVAYRPDRLHRSTRELDDFIALVRPLGVIVWTVAGGMLDLQTSAGRRVAKINGVIAEGESEDMREKIQRAMIQGAAMGKPHGAQTRSYGLDSRRVSKGVYEWEIVPHEAAVIRDAAERLLAGESMLSIVRDLNAREIPAPRGGAWSAQSLKNIVISARVAGWREHRPGRGKNDRAAYSGGEFTAEAEWPAILPRSTVERLRRTIADPSRMRGPNGRTYLLSGGLLVCGECDHRLAGTAGNAGRREYRCSVSGGGCGRVRIGADDVEAWLVEEVRQAHESGRFDAVIRDAASNDGAVVEAHALVEELREERAAYAADAASGAISRAEYLPIRDGIAARLAVAEAALGRLRETESTALLVGGAAEFSRAWDEDETAGNLDRLRARLSAALVRVTVARAVWGRNRFDEGRLDPEWTA